jgi:hypothetical protein
MIDAKKAVGEAKKYFADFFPEQQDTFRLEEIKFDEKKKFWNITLSFYDAKDSKNINTYNTDFESIFNRSISPTPTSPEPKLSSYWQGNRVYKTVHVNANDGSVKGIEIRKF